MRTFSQNSDILLWVLTKIFDTENPFENCVIHMSVLLFLPISHLKRLLPAAKAGSSFSCSFFKLSYNVRKCNILRLSSRGYHQWVPIILKQYKLNVHLCAINHDDI